MSERVKLFCMTVIFFSPLVPRRVWQSDISKRCSDRDALREYFYHLLDHIVIRACTSLAPHRLTGLQSFWKLDDLPITISKRKHVVVRLRYLSTSTRLKLLSN